MNTAQEKESTTLWKEIKSSCMRLIKNGYKRIKRCWGWVKKGWNWIWKHVIVPILKLICWGVLVLSGVFIIILLISSISSSFKDYFRPWCECKPCAVYIASLLSMSEEGKDPVADIYTLLISLAGVSGLGLNLLFLMRRINQADEKLLDDQWRGAFTQLGIDNQAAQIAGLRILDDLARKDPRYIQEEGL